MRIFNSVIIFLIAGILGCMNAEKFELDPMCEYNRNSWGRNPITNRIFKIGDTDCEMDQIILAINAGEPISLCDMLKDVEKCLMNTTNSVKTCLEGEHKDIDIQTKIATLIIGSHCKSIIRLAIIESDQTDAMCFERKARVARRACLAAYPAEREATSIPSHLRSQYEYGLLMPLLQFSYDTQGCSKIQKFERCVTIIMETCGNWRIGELVNSWYTYINNIIPCDNLSKSAASLNCVHHFTEPMKICMEPKYRDTVNITHNVINLLFDFVCENDGHRIKEFVIDGGYECAMYGGSTLLGCVSQVFSDYVPAGDVETRRFPPPLGIEECTIMKNFQRCTLEVFEICERSTPANVLNSMFKFAEQNSPCGNLLEPELSSAKKQN